MRRTHHRLATSPAISRENALPGASFTSHRRGATQADALVQKCTSSRGNYTEPAHIGHISDRGNFPALATNSPRERRSDSPRPDVLRGLVWRVLLLYVLLAIAAIVLLLIQGVFGWGPWS